MTTVDHTDVLATGLLVTANSAGAKLKILAKCYFNTEKVLVEAIKDFLLLTKSFQKAFLSGSLKIVSVWQNKSLTWYFQNADFSA